jgi:anti-anti-sigma factor
MDCAVTSSKSDNGSGIARVTVSGGVTIANCARLKDALVEAMEDSAQIVLEVRDVTSFDFSFLQLVLCAYRSAVASGREFFLRGAGDQLLDQFLVSGLPQVQEFTLDEATADVSEGGCDNG